VLTIKGSVPDKSDWLGVSFYKATYSDQVLDGDYAVYPVSKGNFTRSYNVPEGFESGTYEVALWKNEVARKEIHRLQNMLAYGSGATKAE
jgi:hypothetical protein